MEVDGTIPDAASTQVGDERLTETVKQRSAEQDRDTRGSRVGVDLLEVRRLHIARVEHERTGLIALGYANAVHLEQRPHDGDVTDRRHVAQSAHGLAQERGDHGLRRQVLRALDIDTAAKRTSASDGEDVSGEGRDSVRKSVAHRCRHSEPHFIHGFRGGLPLAPPPPPSY